MNELPYSHPVSQLLTYGETDWNEWDDYTSFGFTNDHIPDLIRMSTDRYLLVDGDIDVDAMWAPMHAWRALCQMGAMDAIPPLVQVLAWIDDTDGDLIGEGITDVLEEFGPPAIDALVDFLHDNDQSNGGLVGAGETLSKIGIAHPEHRERIIWEITSALKNRYKRLDPDNVGFLIADLLDLNAVESYPEIKKVFEEGAVDLSIVGDLEEVEIEFGMRKERSTPAPRWNLLPFAPLPISEGDVSSKSEGEKKREQGKKARKRHKRH